MADSERRSLRREDYEEPRCLLCGDPNGAGGVTPVPQQRILEKYDEYTARRDYKGAERHLLYWLDEAHACRDRRGALVIENELVGHYRKNGAREKAFAHAKEALALVGALGLEGGVSAGTTYTNVATAYNAFGENETAIVWFEKALAVYEADEHTRPELLGGLCNNMALALVALGRYADARKYYETALEVMGNVKDGELEQAITYLNVANALEAEHGYEKSEADIGACLDKAFSLLDAPDVTRGGYYAFVCEKCAPTFSYYGRFLEARELKSRAESIYERA